MNIRKLIIYIAKIKYILFLLIIPTFLFSQTQKNEKQYLVNKNRIIVPDNYLFDTEDMHNLIKQKPNMKILGLFRFHLTMYKFGSNLKPGKFSNWLKNTIGEEPVYLDTASTLFSAHQMKMYLNNKGFFHSKVNFKVNYKKRKANIDFKVTLGKPYKIRNIEYSAEDTLINSLVQNNLSNSLLKKGNNYEVDILNKERERITRDLKKNGFYTFEKEFIFIKLDSSLNKNSIDVFFKINNLSVKLNGDSVRSVRLHQYFLSNIFINTEYDPFTNDTVKYDTIYRRSNYLAFKGRLHIKGKTFSRNIFVKKYNLFNIADVEDTYKRLSELQNFKLINLLKDLELEEEISYLKGLIKFYKGKIRRYL